MFEIIDIEKAEYQPMNNLLSRNKRNIQWEHKYWPDRRLHSLESIKSCEKQNHKRLNSCKQRDQPNIIDDYYYTMYNI